MLTKTEWANIAVYGSIAALMLLVLCMLGKVIIFQ